jgi:phenylacetic acid degradation operon negative regulatory protein
MQRFAGEFDTFFAQEAGMDREDREGKLVDGPAIPDDALQALVRSGRSRIWPLSIAAFAELVEPRGGSIAVATLSAIFDRLGVSTPVLRTTLARLCDRGALVRRKVGRNSFYTLSEWAARETLRKAAIVYTHQGSTYNGLWSQVALVGEGADLKGIKERLREDGFGEVAPRLYMLPESARSHNFDRLPNCLSLTVNLTDPDLTRRVVSLGWDLEDIERRYRAFRDRWKPLVAHLQSLPNVDGLMAVAMRVLLIYEFRRCCLRHPALPYNFGGRDWVGQEAREICANVWRSLLEPSERWLDQHGFNETGTLPAANAGLRLRFAA